MKRQILLSEGRFIDWAIVFIVAKKFILPFRKWKAFQLGLITEKGKRTDKKITTIEEKNAYTVLDRMIRKIRIFVGDRWFLKLTLAYLLLKEGDESREYSETLLLEDENSIVKTFDISSNESITFRYSENPETFTFLISTGLKTPDGIETTSIFGSDEIPKKGNENLLSNFNKVFSKFENSGFDIIKIKDLEGNSASVSINYGNYEIKIESSGSNMLYLGKLYITFDSISKKLKFIQFWKNFINNIKEKKNDL